MTEVDSSPKPSIPQRNALQNFNRKILEFPLIALLMFAERVSPGRAKEMLSIFRDSTSYPNWYVWYVALLLFPLTLTNYLVMVIFAGFFRWIERMLLGED